jgi:enoyl-CoA hydratase
VRAVLVDKDNAPRWRPARLEDVSDADLDALFAPFDDGTPEWTELG